MDTVVQSPSRTVLIGPEQPFCVIGERINPTGRKAFQAQLQAGDLSQLETDVAEQVAGGADMRDVNVGDPLADEVELMRQAVPLVQSLTELPLVIDSSVIEALEAGLAAYSGTVLAVTHDRWFARSFDRFLIFGADGVVREALEPAWDEGRVSRAR